MLEAAPVSANLELYVDCDYLAEGWRDKLRGPSNHDLWQRLWETADKRTGKTNLYKIYPHTEVKEQAAEQLLWQRWLNEFVDGLATEEAKRWQPTLGNVSEYNALIENIEKIQRRVAKKYSGPPRLAQRASSI